MNMRTSCRLLPVVLIAVVAAPLPLLAQDWQARAETAERAGRLTEALDAYMTALNALPETAPYDQEGRLRERIMSIAMRMTPPPAISSEAQRYAIRGNTAVKIGGDAQALREAELEFHRAVRAAPWYSAALYNLALVEEQLEHYDRAIVDFRLYLLTRPNDSQVLLNRISEIESRQEIARRSAARQVRTSSVTSALAKLAVGSGLTTGGYIVGRHCRQLTDSASEDCTNTKLIAAVTMLGAGIPLTLWGAVTLSVAPQPGGIVIAGRVRPGGR